MKIIDFSRFGRQLEAQICFEEDRKIRKKEAKFPGLVNPDGFNAEAELENDMATVIQRANRSKKAREETAKRRQQRSPSQRYQVNVPE